MAKAKNKKKNLAEHINNKKKSQNVKTLNPFEMHINKEKMKVLGRKLKNDRGLPGISRAKALKKRKGTLLQEYKLQHKSNKFIDKRIGERNAGLTPEDRAMARFAAVRAKAHKRKSIFNLADDEVLTHRGQTLNEIEKFDDPRSEDEDSGDEQGRSGKLESDFVGEAHFGGGVLSKTGVEGAKSHKDLINQLIAESKKRKAEKQKTKEKTLELTEKLDTEWKDLIPLVNQNTKQPPEPPKPDVDDYDKVMRELRFEARGQPSDRLKSEDELAKEEKEKLEKLESERLARMKGIFEEKVPNKAKHRSADDLDDDFAYDSDPDITLSYNQQGESNIVIPNAGADEEIEEKKASESEGSSDEAETDSEDDLSDLKEESGDSEDEDQEKQLNKSGDEAEDSAKIMSSEEETVENSCQSDDTLKEDKKQTVVEEGDTKQLKTIEGNDEEAVENDKKQDKENNYEHPIKKVKVAEKNDTEQSKTIEANTKKIKADLLKRKQMMEKAREELPYTFSFPNSYKNLQDLFKDRSAEHQSVILERLIKCNHPSLGESNKEKLGMLFVYLLQHVSDISVDTELKTCFKIFSCLLPQLFDLAQLNQENAQHSVAEVIKEKQLEYRRNRKAYPGDDVLLFLKAVSCLFPTSDFRHQVVTSCIIFIDQMLQKCKVRTKRDIAYGLFLVTLILEYTSLSKRYLPGAISFLAGILHMAIPKSGIRLIKVLPPFRPTSSALVLFKNCSALTIPLKLDVTDLVDAEISEDFKIRTLSMCLKLITEFKANLEELSSNYEIFLPVLQYLKQIPVSNYPEEVQNEIGAVLSGLENLETERRLEYIVMEARRPKALRLYEPNIQKVYDGKTHRVMSKEKADRAKLLHKIKREQKGALREIRRDRSFLGRIKIKQKIQSDKQRHDKVNRIFAEANVQQSELNAMDRQKKRK